jgi:hypothetical protein
VKESTEMKSSITSVVVAAILLDGTFAARAQLTEGDVSHPKARSTHHYSPHHRMRMRGQTERVPSTEDTSGLSYPVSRACSETARSQYLGSAAICERYGKRR